MFVAKTLTAAPIYQAFGTSKAAQKVAENDAYLTHEVQQCHIYRTISGLNPAQAIAAVKIGKAERLMTVALAVMTAPACWGKHRVDLSTI